MLKGFYLALQMGGISTSPVPKEVIDALTSAQVTHTAGQRSGFQLTFQLSKRGLIQTSLLPSGYFDPLTRVQITVVIGGSPTVIMDGVIARQELTASNDPNGSTLSITGEDVSLAMDQIDFTGFPYPCMPAEARVAICIAKYAMYGLIPVVIPSVLFEVPNPLVNIPMHAGTDLAYIQHLARDCGYVFYVTPGPTAGTNYAYWGPEIRYGDVQSTLSINSDASTNVDSMSFSYDGLSSRTYAIMVNIPSTTFSIPIPIPSVGLLRPAIAQNTPLPLKFEPINEGIDKYGPIRGVAIGLARASQAADPVTGSGSLNVLRYGRVLNARSLVDVRGAGQTYDGTYYVKSVTHSIKRGEYKQNFSLAREGILPIQSTVRV